MIFIGDVAIPKEVQVNIDFLPDGFDKSAVIANLEGAIINSNMADLSQNKLYSDINVIDYLKSWNVKAVSLANNHITDVPEAFSNTVNLLNDNNIAFCGAGINIREAGRYIRIEEDGKDIILVGFGWSVISCKKPCRGRVGANLLTKKNVLSTVSNARKENPEAYIVVMPHWDYELEKYPMPAHRELARLAIDCGADAVIGHHPHCVQGIEMYKQRPIVYSMGNWFIPQGIYMNGRLFFPEYANEEYAIEIKYNRILIHWFEFNNKENILMFKKTEPLEHSNRIRHLTPFEGLSGKEYYKWFKKYRIKRKMLPIYKKCNICFENMIKDIWVGFRQIIINFLFITRLRERDINKK